MLRKVSRLSRLLPQQSELYGDWFCTYTAKATMNPMLQQQQQRHEQQQRQTSPSNGASKNTISASEVAKFAAMADSWWDTRGPFKSLHLMNPLRLSFIRSALCQHFKRDTNNAKPLEGLTLLDVGCGGGLLCEPLARMGAQVTGIDAAENNIKVAVAHSTVDPLTSSINYQCTTAEQLVEEQQAFDIVIALEVIEHVKNPGFFVSSLSNLTKEGGAVFMSTINRSVSGYVLAIIAAEYLLQWLPRGTHEWSNFVTPDELALLMRESGLVLQEMAGISFNPLTWKWSLSENTSVNYIAFAAKC